MTLFLAGCGKEPQRVTLPAQLYTYDYPLTTIAADRYGYWTGGEDGELCLVEGNHRQFYQTSLDRIYDILRDHRDSTLLWIASRNAGLQQWRLDGTTLTCQARYPISGKGLTYSVYDICLAGDSLYLATSQGLFALHEQAQQGDSLTCLYPTPRDAATPYPVTKLCVYRGQQILGATANGLLRHVIGATAGMGTTTTGKSGTTALQPTTAPVQDISVDGTTVSFLAGDELHVLYGDRTARRYHRQRMAAIAFYRSNGLNYFITGSDLIVENQQGQRIKAALPGKVMPNAHNTYLADDGNGFSIIAVGNIEMKVPQHIGMGEDNSMQAACTNGRDLFMVTRQGGIFRLGDGSMKAQELAYLSTEDLPVAIDALDDELYFVTADNRLCRLQLRDSYLLNDLLSRPETLMRLHTHATALATDKRNRRLHVGIQDEMLSIDAQSGHVDTLHAMHGKYITQFLPAADGDGLYITTLNHGVFYLSQNRLEPMAGTAGIEFLNNIAVSKGYDQRVYLLTNHALHRWRGPRLDVDGCHGLYAMDSGTLYTLPNNGLLRIRDGGKAMNTRRYYADIHFSAAASQLVGSRLFLGSALGEAIITPGKVQQLLWVTFTHHVMSLRRLMMILMVLVLLLGGLGALANYNRHSLGRLVKKYVSDLRQRMRILNATTAYLRPEDAAAVAQLNHDIDHAEADRGKKRHVTQRAAAISERIMRLNRDVVLQFVATLSQQGEDILQLDCKESRQLYRETRKIRIAGTVEEIATQLQTNEQWLRDMRQIAADLKALEQRMQGMAIVKGVSDGLATLMDHWQDRYHTLSLSELQGMYGDVETALRHLDSTEVTTLLEEHIDKTADFLAHQHTYAHAAQALNARLMQVKEQLAVADRLLVLRELGVIDQHVRQINTLHRLRKVIAEADEEQTLDRAIRDQVARLIDTFFDLMMKTDAAVLTDMLHYSNTANQQVKVLIILLASPKVRRTLLPELLGVVGNLNPVISRLYHQKIGENHDALDAYCHLHPSSMAYFILQLVK